MGLIIEFDCLLFVSMGKWRRECRKNSGIIPQPCGLFVWFSVFLFVSSDRALIGIDGL